MERIPNGRPICPDGRHEVRGNVEQAREHEQIRFQQRMLRTCKSERRPIQRVRKGFGGRLCARKSPPGLRKLLVG